MVSGIDFTTDIEKRPEAKQLLYSLEKYMASEKFNPTQSISLDKIQNLSNEKL